MLKHYLLIAENALDSWSSGVNSADQRRVRVPQVFGMSIRIYIKQKLVWLCQRVYDIILKVSSIEPLSPKNLRNIRPKRHLRTKHNPKRKSRLKIRKPKLIKLSPISQTQTQHIRTLLRSPHGLELKANIRIILDMIIKVIFEEIWISVT